MPMSKGDGGAVGLPENPSALRCWMVAGPEIARVVPTKRKRKIFTIMSQTNGMQIKFVKVVHTLISVLEEMGSPLIEEESEDLMVLDTREILSPAAISTVQTDLKIGQEQFQSFVKERLVDRSKSLNDVIKHNKLPLFVSIKAKSTSKSRQQSAHAKNDSELFS